MQYENKRAKKGKLDRQVYEEVSEISHRITDGGLLLDEYYALHEMLKKI